MNEVWRKIFKKYIEDFHAICKLQSHEIFDEEDTARAKNKLLADIIVTMESEVADSE